VRQEREEHRGELLLGGQDARAVGQRRRDEPGERRDLIADGDAIGRDVDQARKSPARAVDERIVVRGLGATGPPRFEGAVEGLDDSARRQPDARGVDVDARRLEFFPGGFDGQQTMASSLSEVDRATGRRRRPTGLTCFVGSDRIGASLTTPSSMLAPATGSQTPEDHESSGGSS
jgi:hypothetical protein